MEAITMSSMEMYKETLKECEEIRKNISQISKEYAESDNPRLYMMTEVLFPEKKDELIDSLEVSQSTNEFIEDLF